MNDPVKLLQKLISFPSVTPDDAGLMEWLTGYLNDMGFKCERIDSDSNHLTKNLYASIGKGEPNLCFAGHIDVVPPGAAEKWKHQPFAGSVVDGVVYGRGAVDMKGALACFLAALKKFMEEGNAFASISLLITSDEEGPATDGTVKVVKYLQANNVTISDCLVGEPTSVDRVGDMVKIGRRGSVNFSLTVMGKQGHIAYPDLAVNPIDDLLKILHELKGHAIDLGYDFFQPSHLEISSIDVGNMVSNMIPDKASARFNIRFNPNHTAIELADWVKEVCCKHQILYDLQYDSGSEAFLSEKGDLFEVVSSVIADITGYAPRVSTSGGTSDARFIKDVCPVIELGLMNATAHQVDESVSTDDLRILYEIYYQALRRYFALCK